MNAEQFTNLCRKHGACRKGLDWIKGKSLAEFWQTCDRADWMLWIVGRMAGEKGWPTRQDIVLVACLCAETALPFFEKKYPKDDRPRNAIETARAWAKGECDIEEVHKARRAAAYAAYAASAAYSADAASAADAAADAAAYAYAADAAYAAYAADAAAYAAAYAYAAYADAAARAGALRKMAGIVRENLKVPL